MERVFTVPAGPGAVWDVVGELGALVECLPALAQPEIDGDGIAARLRLRVGSQQITYAGRIDLRTADRQGGLIHLDAAGIEARGTGEVSASIRIRLRGTGSGTEVTVDVETAGSGRVAGFDPVAVREAGGRLLDRFVETVIERVPVEERSGSASDQAGQPVAAPVEEPAAVSVLKPAASTAAEPETPLATVTSIAGVVAVRSQARRGAVISAAALLVGILALWITRRRAR